LSSSVEFMYKYHYFMYTRKNWENKQLVPGWYQQAWTRLCGPLWTAEHYQHVVTALFNCNNLEQHGWQLVHSWPHNIVHACRYQLGTTCAFLAYHKFIFKNTTTSCINTKGRRSISCREGR
jgi:hypothetical protein